MTAPGDRIGLINALRPMEPRASLVELGDMADAILAKPPWTPEPEGDQVTHYDVTREGLMDALASHPLGEFLFPEARGRFADRLLEHLPEASPAASEAEIRAEERARVRPILAHKIAVAGGQYDDAFGSDAREAIAQAVTEALDDLDAPGGHYVTFDGDAYYIIEHPASCCATARDLCEPAAAAVRIVGHGAPDGRWRITGVSEGLPDLERVEPQP